MERRQNYSRKREAILNAVRGTKLHPSAEWVYHELKPSYPDLSLGTVNGQERFDGATNPHSHFVCDKCGSVLDIEGGPRTDVCSEVSRRYGVSAERCDIVFRGTCASCCKKSEKVG